MRILVAATLAAVISAAPAHADNPDYNGYVKSIAAPGANAETIGKIEALGEMICDSLRAGDSPLHLANTVQAGAGFTLAQSVLVVHAAQDHICPDTK